MVYLCFGLESASTWMLILDMCFEVLPVGIEPGTSVCMLGNLLTDFPCSMLNIFHGRLIFKRRVVVIPMLGACILDESFIYNSSITEPRKHKYGPSTFLKRIQFKLTFLFHYWGTLSILNSLLQFDSNQYTMKVDILGFFRHFLSWSCINDT